MFVAPALKAPCREEIEVVLADTACAHGALLQTHWQCKCLEHCEDIMHTFSGARPIGCLVELAAATCNSTCPSMRHMHSTSQNLAIATGPKETAQTARDHRRELGRLIRRLVELGVNLDQPDDLGLTALDRAASLRAGWLVHVLLTSGARLFASRVVCASYVRHLLDRLNRAQREEGRTPQSLLALLRRLHGGAMCGLVRMQLVVGLLGTPSNHNKDVGSSSSADPALTLTLETDLEVALYEHQLRPCSTATERGLCVQPMPLDDHQCPWQLMVLNGNHCDYMRLAKALLVREVCAVLFGESASCLPLEVALLRQSGWCQLVGVAVVGTFDTSSVDNEDNSSALGWTSASSMLGENGRRSSDAMSDTSTSSSVTEEATRLLLCACLLGFEDSVALRMCADASGEYTGVVCVPAEQEQTEMPVADHISAVSDDVTGALVDVSGSDAAWNEFVRRLRRRIVRRFQILHCMLEHHGAQHTFLCLDTARLWVRVCAMCTALMSQQLATSNVTHAASRVRGLESCVSLGDPLHCSSLVMVGPGCGVSGEDSAEHGAVGCASDAASLTTVDNGDVCSVDEGRGSAGMPAPVTGVGGLVNVTQLIDFRECSEESQQRALATLAQADHTTAATDSLRLAGANLLSDALLTRVLTRHACALTTLVLDQCTQVRLSTDVQAALEQMPTLRDVRLVGLSVRWLQRRRSWWPSAYGGNAPLQLPHLRRLELMNCAQLRGVYVASSAVCEGRVVGGDTIASSCWDEGGSDGVWSLKPVGLQGDRDGKEGREKQEDVCAELGDLSLCIRGCASLRTVRVCAL
ncbi:hypothetical protein PTSG_01258 [Salpingoeca rosetta]|uniref:Uncharacterized protein n=1 Tax=Salpingoeca rosetta (strain ATCC 50818 / BSB-021) TaxID=946362 RepID=F2TZU0_SALR5|nr:uncharacterized protein PTSG_01258 [Salpingoeca rosetta]EGD80668.1 hypothetical protein PTSG_01258 [Salpingoeca rosetta]|eukprot:XP_004997229.1 hypothetical protein PTSG_01258 [Salpingoeca rosetta]